MPKMTRAMRRKRRQRRLMAGAGAAFAMICAAMLILIFHGENMDNAPVESVETQPEEPAWEEQAEPVPEISASPTSAWEPEPELTPEIEAVSAPEPTPEAAEEPVPAITLRPDAEIPIAIYIPIAGSQNRRIVNGFGSQWVSGKDIDCFEVLLSEEKEEKGNRFYQIFDRLWAAQPEAEGHRIGYELMLTLKNGSVHTHVILKPSDVTDDFFAYVECYLYDDIHQNGAWEYYHLLQSNMKKSTLITSIKLTAGKKIDQVEEIQLTAFLYRDGDDFNQQGRYCGKNYWTINIHNQ